MRIVRTYVLAFLSLPLPFPVFAQKTAATVQRDALAVATLNEAIAVLGGSPSLAAIHDCVISGSIQRSTGGAPTVQTFTWTIAGDEFRLETGGIAPGVFLSGHGSPASIRGGKTLALNYHVARANQPFFLPGYVLFAELNNPIYTLASAGSASVQGIAAIHIHISDDSDAVGKLVTAQDWFFDPATFLPLRVEFRLPTNENAADYSVASMDFADYRQTNGVMLPFRIAYSQDGQVSAIAMVDKAIFNSGIPPSV